MTPVDYLVIGLCIVSAGLGFWRGFTREALALLTLLAAIWLAWRFAWVVEPYLGDWAGAPEARLWAARAIVFVLVSIIGSVASWFARKLIHVTGLSSMDRLFGALFGAARGALLFGLAVIVLEFTGLHQDAWWQQARLKVYGERIAAGIRYYTELGNRYLRDQQLVQRV
jgi:membrane protein required for colicin V production